MKKATNCQVWKKNNWRRDTGYNTSKIKGWREVDEIVGFCGEQHQKRAIKYFLQRKIREMTSEKCTSGAKELASPIIGETS